MIKLIVAVSTVKDGNMAIRDQPDNLQVKNNRTSFLENHNITPSQTTCLRITYDRQDYCSYQEVSASDKGLGMTHGKAVLADALVTRIPNHALLLPLADCVGTVIYDPVHKVLMLSHLGRHSLVQYGGEKSVQFLIEHYDSNPADLHVWLTPAPSKEAYPIWQLDGKGFKEALYEQLERSGIKREHITDDQAETDKDPRYFSHSEFLAGRQKSDGRYAIVAMMHE